MKRRTFGLLAGTSMAALKFGPAEAQTAADPSLLTTTLNPLGGIRAGNADGSIPAWTGGWTTLPSGWQDGGYMPDFFAGEQPTLTIDSSNMAQHADRLSVGAQAMMTKFGFSMKIFPTHRTATAPQDVYDNIALNVTRAKLDPAGPQLGFSNAVGGIPFPIPDTSNPLVAGAQIIWNHRARWSARAFQIRSEGWVVNDGQVVLSDQSPSKFDFPYYHKGVTPENFDGLQYRQVSLYTAPPNIVGQSIVAWYSTDNYRQPDIAWELLNGQGRMRKAPELTFDTPSSYADGQANYDEYFGFLGSLEKYDWKYIEKKEMYIPYNNNALYLLTAEEAHLPHFLDPNVVRWELHRVWVVEATLRSGERNVMAKRRYYVDEDTFIIAATETYDANGDLFHVGSVYNNVRPDLPGTVFGDFSLLNLETGDYVTGAGSWNEKAHPSIRFFDSYPASMFDPQNAAANGQY